MSSNGQSRPLVRASRVTALVAALLLVGATGADASGATVRRDLSCGASHIRTESGSSGTVAHMHWSSTKDYIETFTSGEYQEINWNPKLSKSGGWVISSAWLVKYRGYCS
ncbi:hypothetical protein [Cellulomonas triticagri]|nr:hypothetical protein [Cellulomonas triticagri]